MEGSQTAQERSVDENLPMIGSDPATELERPVGNRVAATTDDDGALTYSLGGPDAASFSITSDMGQLQTKAVLDYETKDTYTVTVTATDSFGISSTITVTIKVGDVDEMPELVGEAPEEYAENGTGAVATFTAADPEGKSITWTLGGTDAAAFSIENGVLRFMSPPDYERRRLIKQSTILYEVTIQASDGGDDTTATKEVSIDGHQRGGAWHGDSGRRCSPRWVRISRLRCLTRTPSTDLTTITWQWYRGSSPIAAATNGAGTITSVYMPAAGDVGSVLRATAMYDDAEGDDKTARQNSYRNVRSAPQSNTDPVFPDQDRWTGRRRYQSDKGSGENTPAGTNLGAPVAANDPGDVLTYSLDTGTDAAAFNIVRSSGQLQTKADLDFDDDKTSYTVTVTATDPFGDMATSQVTITVTDVNEAPICDGGAASIDHTENGSRFGRHRAGHQPSVQGSRIHRHRRGQR